jgi:hypothetical protein
VLLLLHADCLEYEMVRDTLNVLLKFEEDVEAVGSKVPTFVHKALSEAEGCL